MSPTPAWTFLVGRRGKRTSHAREKNEANSMITIKQLEAFYWSAELEGFEAAAERLSTTQSAVSKRMQELEATLGFALFDRSRRKAQVTPRGEELRSLAWEVLSLRTRIMDMSKASQLAPRTFRIGVTELTAMTWLPNVIQRIRGSHPQVTLEPVVDTSVSLVNKLKAAELDLVVVPDAFREPHLEVVPLDSVEYAWVCSPSYLADVERLPLKAMAQYTIIEQSHASGLGNMIGHWLSDHNVKFQNTLASSNLTASASLTLSGVGICYLPRRIFDDMISMGQLRVIRSTPAIPRVPYVLLYEKSKADDFLRFVTAVATDTCDFTRTMPAYFSARTGY